MDCFLKDIAIVGAGQGAPQGDDKYSEDGLPFIKAGNLGELIEGKSIKEIQKVSKEVANEYRLKIFPEGTIVFAKSGMSCLKGYVYVLSQDAYVVNHLACVTPNDNISDFLKYYFGYHKPNQLIKDVAYPSIRLEDIKNLKVDIKTDSCRNRIVGQLKSIENIIGLKKQELSKLDDLIKSRFVEMFGDIFINPFEFQESKVSDYCEMTQGKQIPMSEQITEDREGYYRYLYINDLKYNYSDRIYVKDCYDNKKLSKSDLVVVNTGNTAGEIYRGKDGILSNNLFKVSFDENVLLTTYLFYYFRSDSFQKMLWGEMKEGAQPHLGHKIFGNKKLIIPPIEKQNEFELFVKQVDKLKFVK